MRVRRIVALGALVIAVLLALAVARSGPEYGRSMVGIAKRSDGRVVVVTAWCIANRAESLHIRDYTEGQLGRDLLVRQARSSEALTVMEIDEPLPRTPLVVYNTGSRRDWLIRREFPSAATVFLTGELPVSDQPLPDRVMVGATHIVPRAELVAAKCQKPR